MTDDDQRFSQLFESSPLAIAVSRLDDRLIVDVNAAYQRLFGVGKEAIGKTASAAGVVVEAPIREQFWALLHERGWIHDAPVTVTTPIGRRYVRLWCQVIDFATGRHIVSSYIDVTEQTKLEAQVRQAQKLDSLGMLASGVAHDVNNVLSVIGASAQLLGLTATPKQQELLDDVEHAVKRGTSMTRQLLAFSRKQDVRPSVVDVNRTVEDTLKMLGRMIGEEVSVECSLAPDLREVIVDPSSLVQVLMNLAVNARDAMPSGGQLTVSTKNVSGDRDEVLLGVTDTGTGISPEVQSRLFEPFFTTKEAGKGTGLGLSVVHGIVRQAGGRVEVATELGRGTSFLVYFPAAS